MPLALDLETALNAEQIAAVTGPDGPALVLAAAGTGKTRTLVYRVAYLVHRGVAPERILLLTFTHRAAEEMLDRARALVGPEVSGVWGGTFHHLANRLLRRHARAVDLEPDYTILDREDSRKLVGECLPTPRGARDGFPTPEVLLSLFAAVANTGSRLEDRVREQLAHTDVDPQEIARVREAYEARKRRLNALDFDDLLVYAVRLFRTHPETSARYGDQFLHVLVDEYQDTNPLQAELVDRLGAQHRNVMVVGDDFQSIYGWRGADIEHILSFPRRYPDARIYKLETNYRSTPEILSVANRCIAASQGQIPKLLRPTRPSLARPELVLVRDGETQAQFVARHLMDLRRSGFTYSDIAVLYRAHFHSLELQMELTRLRVPFLLTSGVRFFEQAHIKDVCSLLRILENPRDEVAFVRLLSLLPGVGPRTANRLWTALGGIFDASSETSCRRLEEQLPRRAARIWHRIVPILTAYREESLADHPGEVIHRFVQTYYAEYAELHFENADRRLEDARELTLYTTRFEGTAAFLAEAALLTSLEAEEDRTPQGGDRVRLSTVHQAKGLEWRAIVVLWLVEGLFPLARSLAESATGEGEERRLFYVAVTRAKDHLTLCVPEVRRLREGGIVYTEPSRFVRELAPELTKTVRLAWVG